MRSLFLFGSWLLAIFSICQAQPRTPVPATPATTEIRVGMTDTAAYFPLLRGRRVAVLANHTSVAAMPDAEPLPDAAQHAANAAGAPDIPAKMIHPVHPEQQPPSSCDAAQHAADTSNTAGTPDIPAKMIHPVHPEQQPPSSCDAAQHAADTSNAAGTPDIPAKMIHPVHPGQQPPSACDAVQHASNASGAPDIPAKMIHPVHPEQQPPSAEDVAAAQAPGPQQTPQQISPQTPPQTPSQTPLLVHLVDLLHARGFDVTGIFSPEHGFRGTADAGEHVRSSVDPATGIPIRSLYDGRSSRPSDETMRSFDVLVVDMQDVGLRFYTYYITMLRMMDACAAHGIRVIVLDRPNPNGDKVDGPLLDPAFRSGVGALPIPVLHGLTMGEIARMAVGEGWAAPCDLTIVPCRGYTHSTPYELPVAPSPNLQTQRAVYLYASLCLFEGTSVSVGRGTERPFEVYGHPGLKDFPYSFTPRPMAGAKHPPHEGVLCRGEDLGRMPLDEARAMGLSLRRLIDACRALGCRDDFFNPMFEKLIGVDYVRPMILAGADEEDIRARWADDLRRYRALRRSYLLYAE